MRPDARIAAVAARQHGVFTHAQALLAGSSADAIRHRIITGRLITLYRGVYMIAGAPTTPQGSVLAAVLAYGERSAASHLTAAALLGLTGEVRPPVHLTMPQGQHREPRLGIKLHQAILRRTDVRTVLGIRVTSPNRTLVDSASLLTPERLEAALDAAVLARVVSVASLDRYIVERRLTKRRGAGTLRRMLADRSTGARESELERMFVRKLSASGLPAPVPQFRIGRRRIDFAYPHEKIAIELDGLASHFSADAFKADRRRQNEIAMEEWLPLRFGWEDVDSRWPTVENTLRKAITQRGGVT